MLKYYLDQNRRNLLENVDCLNFPTLLNNTYFFWNFGYLDFIKYYHFYDDWRESDIYQHYYAFLSTFESIENMITFIIQNQQCAFFVQNELFQAKEPFLLDELIAIFWQSIQKFSEESIFQKIKLINTIPQNIFLQTLLKIPEFQEDIWNYLIPAKNYILYLKELLSKEKNFEIIEKNFRAFLMQVKQEEILSSIYENIFFQTSIHLNDKESLYPNSQKIRKLIDKIDKNN